MEGVVRREQSPAASQARRTEKKPGEADASPFDTGKGCIVSSTHRQEKGAWETKSQASSSPGDRRGQHGHRRVEQASLFESFVTCTQIWT